jgi:hypothetical protein
MHEEILSSNQKNLLPLIHNFSDLFFLIGGTAIALQLGHRRSIDLDLASFSKLNIDQIRNNIREKFKIKSTLVESPTELSIVISDVKITFLYYPFEFSAIDNFNDIIKIPDLITLGALKSFALGRRAKWKDYVDLYFIFQNHSLSEVVTKTKQIYGHEFNEKLFREQLAYFKDIDYSEKIDYLPAKKVEDQQIKTFLQQISLEKSN